jgi:PKD repeat protein
MSLILMLIISTLTVNVCVAPPGDVLVYVSPSTNSVPPGQYFTISIDVDGVEASKPLNYWEIKLQYNSQVLYTDKDLIHEGGFLIESQAGQDWGTQLTGPVVTASSIQVGCYIIGPGGADGSGTLVTIDFLVQKKGTSFLHLYDTILHDETNPYDPAGLIAHITADGYFSNFINVAVTNVKAFPTIASVGEPVSINATVMNGSNVTETFDVTVYYNATTIGTQTVTNLNMGTSTTLTFNWATAGLAADIYNISANASVVEGETDTADNSFVDCWVRLTTNPAALFTFSPRFPLPNQNVTFDASSALSPNGVIDSYEWNFGDGNTTTVASKVITHFYTALGTYNVTLNVTDNFGLWNVRYKLVAVKSLPAASFVFSPETPVVNEAVKFNASASSDPDGPIVSYKWDFGDDNVTTVSSATITHAYDSFGSFTVTLNVTDTDEHWDIYTQIFTVKSLPAASFTFSPATPKVNEVVTFDASASSDPDGSIDKYVWTFGDGGTSTGKTATHTYTSFGSFTVTLNVTDNDKLWDIETKTFTVKSLPAASFTFSPATPKVNEVVTFDASASSDPDGSIVSYKWDFGDGNITTVSSATITHTYAASQSYTVTLTVTDNDGFTNVQTSSVSVEEAPQTNILLYVGVAVIIIVAAAALLFYFFRRKR